MSQGSNSSGGGGSGNKIAKSVKTQSGKEFDISDSPLVYSDPKHGLSQAQLDTIQAFTEDKWAHDRASEYGVIIGADGSILWSDRGRNGTISMAVTKSEDQITGHTHPRKGGNGYQDGLMGGTFSYYDIEGHVDSDKARTQFASAFEGIYFMTKQSNFDGAGLKKYAQQVEANREKEHKDRMTTAGRLYTTNQISRTEYLNEYYKSFNMMLIGMHNDYLDGQKQYGYTYGLVERKS